ncbi:g159 [Yersinia phage fHe-Yen9-04]|uniref:G159 protein n=2 Tax=Eneladusvirus Yen904 TaxID=2560849 RepID=A0A2C9CXF6_9CAUD|nr:hypothetical protein FDJ41_gp159 [Yersinia phage fHe-Yen9-04]SOK58436.1 g159 [Yersinia phage fHe-Yen9-04]SOK58970.1 hypothetical protein [Yersinia phage fHe-Yen9-03]VUE36205.1 g159 [Yersinia phage fHe-Yen9-04]
MRNLRPLYATVVTGNRTTRQCLLQILDNKDPSKI